MLAKEKELVNLQFIKREDTYNRVLGGSEWNTLGMTQSEESRKKISEARKGKKRKPHSLETRKKQSEKATNRKHSTETRQKLSKLLKGLMIGEKNGFYKKNHSKETRCVMSAKKLGGKLKADHKKAIGEGVKKFNQTLTEEQYKAKFCKKGELNPFFNKKHTDEHKKKISEIETGKIYLSNIELDHCIKIEPSEKQKYLNQGYVEGRKIKYTYVENKETNLIKRVAVCNLKFYIDKGYLEIIK